MARLRVADDTSAWEELRAQVSWEEITAAHRSTTGLSEHDYKTLAIMTAAAARRWALGDTGRIVAVEQRVLVEVPENEALAARRWPMATKEREQSLRRDGARLFKGFLDLVLANQDEITIVDWKTTADAGPRWRSDRQHSWQAKLYAWAYGAQRVVFRGVEHGGRTVEVDVQWPVLTDDGHVAFGNSSAEQYVRSAFGMRDSFRSAPWPQNMPVACNKFGRPCPHLEMCTKGTAPVGQVDGPLSYSGADTLLAICPERYRLDHLLADNDPDDDARTAIGRAFHAGMQSLYTQLGRLSSASN